MANSQTADWRLRETINKRIARQIRKGYTPLTKYKSLYPFEEGADIVDRRTGKIKHVNTFIKEYQAARGGTVENAKRAYSLRLHVLASEDITQTKIVKKITREQVNAVMARFLASYKNWDSRAEAEAKLSTMTVLEQLEAIRYAKRRSCPGGHYTESFFNMIAEYLDVDLPEPPTP